MSYNQKINLFVMFSTFEIQKMFLTFEIQKISVGECDLKSYLLPVHNINITIAQKNLILLKQEFSHVVF